MSLLLVCTGGMAAAAATGKRDESIEDACILEVRRYQGLSCPVSFVLIPFRRRQAGSEKILAGIFCNVCCIDLVVQSVMVSFTSSHTRRVLFVAFPCSCYCWLSTTTSLSWRSAPPAGKWGQAARHLLACHSLSTLFCGIPDSPL